MPLEYGLGNEDSLTVRTLQGVVVVGQVGNQRVGLGSLLLLALGARGRDLTVGRLQLLSFHTFRCGWHF